MEYGAHLPLIDFSGKGFSLAELRAYAKRASELGYTFLCANDHLLFSRPWLDGPTALAAVLEASGAMRLATTVSIPVVRGPMVSAKILAAIDLLSGGRLVVGVGPGSSERDYMAVGVPFEERWKRFEEMSEVLRTLWTPQSEGFRAAFIQRMASSLSLILLSGLLRRFGWQAGGKRRGCAVSLVTVTDGWLRDTTPHLRDLQKVLPIFPNNSLWSEKNLRVFPIASPPCGCASQKTAPKRKRFFPQCLAQP